MSDMLNDNFGLLIRQAMQARPEPAPAIDVAAAALDKVRAREAALARLARMRWWGRMLGVAAGILIVAVLAVGWYVLPSSTSTDSSADSSTSTTSSETSTSSSSSSLDMGTIGLGALAIVLVGVTAAGVMSGDRSVRVGIA